LNYIKSRDVLCASRPSASETMEIYFYGVGDGVGDAVGANVLEHTAPDMITFASEMPKSAAICAIICVSKLSHSGNESQLAPAYGFAMYTSANAVYPEDLSRHTAVRLLYGATSAFDGHSGVLPKSHAPQ